MLGNLPAGWDQKTFTPPNHSDPPPSSPHPPHRCPHPYLCPQSSGHHAPLAPAADATRPRPPLSPPRGFSPKSKSKQTAQTDSIAPEPSEGLCRRWSGRGGGTGELRGGCVHGAEPAARPQPASHGGIHPKQGPAVSPSPTQGMAGASQDSRCPSPQPGCPLGLPRAGTRWGHCSWF